MQKFQVGDVVTIVACASGFGIDSHLNTLSSWLSIGSVFTITKVDPFMYVDGDGYIYQSTSPDGHEHWWLTDGCLELKRSEIQNLPLFKEIVNE